MHGDDTIERMHGLPEGLDALVRESVGEGFSGLQRLQQAWQDGRNRFERSGEALFAARAGGRLVGVCGLNVDPYLDDSSVGRVRHLYV